eukprot:1331560-Amorphochlora_amoeboformis.AAC.3
MFLISVDSESLEQGFAPCSAIYRDLYTNYTNDNNVHARRDPKLREKIVNFGFNKKLTAGAPTVRKAISEFFFNAHHPKPWLNNYVWVSTRYCVV